MFAFQKPIYSLPAVRLGWLLVILLALLVPPQGAQAQPGSPRMTASTTTSVTIAWDGVGAGATYEYQQVLPRLRSSVNVGSVTRITITSLSHSTYYGFQIRSILNGVTSDWTGVADGHTKPLAPPNFRATCVAGAFVELKWNAPQQSQVSLSPTSFQYELKINSGAWQSRAGSRARKVDQLSLGTTYTFAVRTVLDRSGFVGYSDASTLTVTTAAAQVEPPTGLQTSDVTNTSVKLTWTASATSSVSYEVSIDGNTWVDSGSDLEHTFSGLDPETRYSLRARAKSGISTSCANAAPPVTTLPSAPSAPTSLQTSGISQTAITLGWTKSVGATAYKARKDSSDSWTTLGDVASHTFTGLTANTQYTLEVIASNSGGDSSAATESASTLPNAPDAPTSLSTSGITQTAITLNWTKATGATAYKVQVDSGTVATLGDVATHTFSGLTADTSYTLKVIASNAGGDSSEVSVSERTLPNVPAAPTSLSVDNITQTAARLNWTKSSGATSYEVNGGALSQWTDVGDVATYTFSGLTANTTYNLRVRAVNRAGNSGPAAFSASTLPNIPAAPTGLADSAHTQNGITLSWTKSPGATGYKVQVNSGDVTTLSDVATHTFSGLSADTSYTLKVIAFNRAGDSSAASVSASTLPNAPDAPTSLQTSGITQTAITLGWTKSAGATAYKVQVDSGTVATLGDVATHTFSGLTADTSYTLKVIASNAGGDSSEVSVSESTLPNLPAAPTSLSVDNITQTAARLNWTKSSGATSYEVNGGALSQWTDVGDVATYTFSGLTANTTYNLRVRAVNRAGNSGPAAFSASTLPNAPAAPTSLQTSGISQTAITLGWTKSSGATGYKVQANSGTVATLGDVATHTFSGLSANTSYTLTVIAFNNGGDSSAASVSASTLAAQPAALADPTSVSTSGITQTAITLNWTKETAAASYEVQGGSHSSWHDVGDVATYEFTGLTADTQYTLKVRSKNSQTTSTGVSVSASTLPNAPAAPTSLQTSGISQTGITLTWTKSAGATAYKVRKDSGDSWTALGDVATYSFTGLTAGTSYDLEVSATNTGGDSAAASVTAVTVPAAPTGLSTSGITQTGITLTWTKSTGATAYKARKDSADSWTTLGDVATYTFTGLTANTQYTLEALASNAGGDSAAASVSARTLASQPATLASPTSVQTSGITQTNITLNWSKSSGATSYEVQGGTLNSWTDVGNVATYNFSGLSADTQYTLQVRAKNNQTTSAGISVTERTLPQSLGSPQNLRTEEVTENQVVIAWTEPAESQSLESQAVMNYQVQGGMVTSWTDIGDVNKYMFDGLSEGTEYNLRVRAQKSGLYSPPAAISARTLGSGSSGQPSWDDNSDRDSSSSGAAARSGQTLSSNPAFNCNDEQKAMIAISPQPVGLNVQCVGPVGVGDRDLIARGVVLGVDVWGWVRGYFEVCFKQAGDLAFLDAAYAPRQLKYVIPYNRDGMICNQIDRAGTLVLLRSKTSTEAAATPTPRQAPAAEDCRVTTTDPLNFRASPGGQYLLTLPALTTLSVHDRRGGWLLVDYRGRQGWVSAIYTVPVEDCG